MVRAMAKRLGWYVPEQLVLKITLAESKPAIWRRVEVHSGLTLEDLHYVIQCVFGWTNSHLYHFLVAADGKVTGAAQREAQRYHMLPPDPMFLEEQGWPADEAMLGRIFTTECKQIVYEYDFGDSWQHVVKLEQRTPGGEQDHVPQCLAGENAAPLDDMGGIFGYYEFLDALRNPAHESHEDAVEWFGKDFDPARFDLAKANRRLAKTFKPIPTRPRKPRKPRKKS
jgi:hypothetical protein